MLLRSCLRDVCINVLQRGNLWYDCCKQVCVSYAGGSAFLGRMLVKASLDWLASSGAEFSAGLGQRGCAYLKSYTAEYREWGRGRPLVLVPGLAGGFELLGPLARLLAQRYRVISYQLRGEDDCFALRRGFGLKDLVDDLAEFLDWHCLESPIIFGVSFGGVLALEFAARFPHRLEALIIQGAGARFERGLLQRVAGWILNDYPLPHDNPFVNQFFNLLFGSRKRPDPLFRFVTGQCWQTDQSVMAHRFRLVERFDVHDRLDRVHVPTLVLAGDRDLLVSEKSLKTLCGGIENCRRVNLPGCGHLAFVTQPERVAREVCQFLPE
jgi:pimeloyl-ACP methyl ester carboxylesterase